MKKQSHRKVATLTRRIRVHRLMSYREVAMQRTHRRALPAKLPTGGYEDSSIMTCVGAIPVGWLCKREWRSQAEHKLSFGVATSNPSPQPVDPQATAKVAMMKSRANAPKATATARWLR